MKYWASPQTWRQIAMSEKKDVVRGGLEASKGTTTQHPRGYLVHEMKTNTEIVSDFLKHIREHGPDEIALGAGMASPLASFPRSLHWREGGHLLDHLIERLQEIEHD